MLQSGHFLKPASPWQFQSGVLNGQMDHDQGLVGSQEAFQQCVHVRGGMLVALIVLEQDAVRAAI